MFQGISSGKWFILTFIILVWEGWVLSATVGEMVDMFGLSAWFVFCILHGHVLWPEALFHPRQMLHEMHIFFSFFAYIQTCKAAFKMVEGALSAFVYFFFLFAFLTLFLLCFWICR